MDAEIAIYLPGSDRFLLNSRVRLSASTVAPGYESERCFQSFLLNIVPESRKIQSSIGLAKPDMKKAANSAGASGVT